MPSYRKCALLTIIMIPVGGCAITANSRATIAGKDVPQDVFNRVMDGQTTKAWLLEKLGSPTATLDRGDGMEDLEYTCAKRVKDHVSILFLLSFNSSVDRTEECIFELKDEVVHKHYRRIVEKQPESNGR